VSRPTVCFQVNVRNVSYKLKSIPNKFSLPATQMVHVEQPEAIRATSGSREALPCGGNDRSPFATAIVRRDRVGSPDHLICAQQH
jgi:hypothetical protein